MIDIDQLIEATEDEINECVESVKRSTTADNIISNGQILSGLTHRLGAYKCLLELKKEKNNKVSI